MADRSEGPNVGDTGRSAPSTQTAGLSLVSHPGKEWKGFGKGGSPAHDRILWWLLGEV